MQIKGKLAEWQTALADKGARAALSTAVVVGDPCAAMYEPCIIGKLPKKCAPPRPCLASLHCCRNRTAASSDIVPVDLQLSPCRKPHAVLNSLLSMHMLGAILRAGTEDARSAVSFLSQPSHRYDRKIAAGKFPPWFLRLYLHGIRAGAPPLPILTLSAICSLSLHSRDRAHRATTQPPKFPTRWLFRYQNKLIDSI